MGNPSPSKKIQGTIGELLTQIRFLQYGVELSIPVIDSGNDIVALKGGKVKLIQVKTKKHNGKRRNFPNLREYNILVLINFGEDENKLDEAKIYLLSKEEVSNKKSIGLTGVEKYKLSNMLIDTLFDQNR